MDSKSIYDDLPWDLIGSALREELSPDEDLRFRQWLTLSVSNRKTYDQLLQMWTDGMAGYAFYQDADENKAWEALQKKMAGRGPAHGNDEAKVISTSPVKVTPVIRRWSAVAAILLLAAGAGWWFITREKGTTQYETSLNEQKKISLPDGSTVSLSQQTRIRIDPAYNKAGRTVVLTGGEAYFEVSHQERLPFMVDMDVASIRDIGTSFTVQKTKDSIKVMVSTGKVAFIKKETGESREISAGSSLCLYTTEHRFGEIKATPTVNISNDALRFDNAPLSDVVAVLQKRSGKKILLSDAATAQKKLTAHLEGESFDNAIKIICASLNLEYAEKSGVYILKSRDTTTHN
jgi:transmembrane sensor